MADEHKRVSIADMGIGSNYRKKFRGVGQPVEFPTVSAMEWEEMQDKARTLYENAGDGMKLTGFNDVRIRQLVLVK